MSIVTGVGASTRRRRASGSNAGLLSIGNESNSVANQVSEFINYFNSGVALKVSDWVDKSEEYFGERYISSSLLFSYDNVQESELRRSIEQVKEEYGLLLKLAMKEALCLLNDGATKNAAARAHAFRFGSSLDIYLVEYRISTTKGFWWSKTMTTHSCRCSVFRVDLS
jgi:hypothetical protein